MFDTKAAREFAGSLGYLDGAGEEIRLWLHSAIDAIENLKQQHEDSMTKFAKYANAQEFAIRESLRRPDARFVILQVGAADFLVMTEGAYRSAIICAYYVNGDSVGGGV